MRRLTTTLLVLVSVAVVAPSAVQMASAEQFDDPLGIKNTTAEAIITNIIANTIDFLFGLAGIIALAALTYGGLRLVLGSAASEQDIARAKQIIYWAIIGLLIAGLGGVILSVIKVDVLGI